MNVNEEERGKKGRKGKGIKEGQKGGEKKVKGERKAEEALSRVCTQGICRDTFIFQPFPVFSVVPAPRAPVSFTAPQAPYPPAHLSMCLPSSCWKFQKEVSCLEVQIENKSK